MTKTKNTVYETKKEAMEAMLKVGMQEDNDGKSCYVPGQYCLSHGEIERPDFKPVFRRGIGWMIKFIPYYRPGTCHAPKEHYVSLIEYFDGDYGLEDLDR